MIPHNDPRVMAAAGALAEAAVAEFLRISDGEGRRWDELPPDRQEAAIRSQVGYAQTAIIAADAAAADATTTWYSDGGPAPTTPSEFAEQVQEMVLDTRLTTAAELDIQLGQLAVAYADQVLPNGMRLPPGPRPLSEAVPPGLRDEVEQWRDATSALLGRIAAGGAVVAAIGERLVTLTDVLGLIDNHTRESAPTVDYTDMTDPRGWAGQ